MHIKAQSIIKVEKIPSLEMDKELLRGVMAEELEAINLYEQMRASTEDEKIKALLTDLIKDEKEHFDKAEDLLEMLEPEEEEGGEADEDEEDGEVEEED